MQNLFKDFYLNRKMKAVFLVLLFVVVSFCLLLTIIPNILLHR